LANGQTARGLGLSKLKAGQKASKQKQRKSEPQYRNIPAKAFCLKGNNGRLSFPVDSQKRCRAALAYARYAPNPAAVVRCAMAKAKAMGWSCGQDSSQVRRLGLSPARGKNTGERRRSRMNVRNHHTALKRKQYMIYKAKYNDGSTRIICMEKMGDSERRRRREEGKSYRALEDKSFSSAHDCERLLRKHRTAFKARANRNY
jgi:hypothetical protein